MYSMSYKMIRGLHHINIFFKTLSDILQVQFLSFQASLLQVIGIFTFYTQTKMLCWIEIIIL